MKPEDLHPTTILRRGFLDGLTSDYVKVFTEEQMADTLESAMLDLLWEIKGNHTMKNKAQPWRDKIKELRGLK